MKQRVHVSALAGLGLAAVTQPAAALGIDVGVDAAAGYTGGASSLALSGLGHLEVIDGVRLGAGLRLSHFGGRAASYRAVGDTTLALPDRLQLKPDVSALNLLVSGEVRLFGPLSAGANLDVIGISFGPRREVAGTSAQVANLAAFLVGERDRGALDSEFYLALRLPLSLQVRAGLNHFVTGYDVSADAGDGRYQRFASVAFVALRWFALQL